MFSPMSLWRSLRFHAAKWTVRAASIISKRKVRHVTLLSLTVSKSGRNVDRSSILAENARRVDIEVVYTSKNS